MYAPPVSKNYQSPLVMYPSAVPSLGPLPPGGGKCIPCEIDWGTMGGSNNSVYVNLNNNATQEFKPIISLLVDNSDNAADVIFYFPDIPFTYTIPAYTPYALIPVFTGQQQLYVTSANAESEAITRFQFLNYLPPPIVIPISSEQDTASVTGIDMGTASTQLIPSTVNGTLEVASINLDIAASNTGSGTWILEDGTGAIIAQGSIQVSSGAKSNVILFQASGLQVRFLEGLKMVCTQSAVIGGTITANLYYRTP